MEIKEEISTLSERQHWQDFFRTFSKEELTDLLLDRMIEDRNFCRELFYKFSKDSSTVSEMITNYETTVTDELSLKVVDVHFLRILSDRVMRRAAAEVNLLDKFRLYSTVIKNLDIAICAGAGWENEDDDVLIELMDECPNLMLAFINDKQTDLPTKDFDQVYDLLKNESDSYNPIDGNNRLEAVLCKIQETESKRRLWHDPENKG